MSDLSWLNPTPHATTVASGHATLATKRTLLLTWAGLAPAGSHQLCLAHLFDDLIGRHQQAGRHHNAEGSRGLEIDSCLIFGRCLDRQLGRFGAAQDIHFASQDLFAIRRARPPFGGPDSALSAVMLCSDEDKVGIPNTGVERCVTLAILRFPRSTPSLTSLCRGWQALST